MQLCNIDTFVDKYLYNVMVHCYFSFERHILKHEKIKNRQTNKQTNKPKNNLLDNTTTAARSSFALTGQLPSRGLPTQGNCAYGGGPLTTPTCTCVQINNNTLTCFHETFLGFNRRGLIRS